MRAFCFFVGIFESCIFHFMCKRRGRLCWGFLRKLFAALLENIGRHCMCLRQDVRLLLK